MSTRVKIGLLAVMVALVAVIVVWDGSNANPNTTADNDTGIRLPSVDLGTDTSEPDLPTFVAQNSDDTATGQFASGTEASATPEPNTDVGFDGSRDVPDDNEREQPEDNVAGEQNVIDPIVPQVQESAVSVTEQTYTTRSNDSLWKIAKKFYGKGHLYAKIFEANRDILPSESDVPEGLVLTIPALEVENRASNTNGSSAAPAEGTYVVVDGDSLWSIAVKVWGSGNAHLFNKIFEANTDTMSRPDDLSVGQVLRIPDIGAETSSTNGIQNMPAEVNSGTGAVYKIRSGDRLWTIAQRFYGEGSRWEEIYNANKDRLRMSSPDDLSEGETLVLPGLTQAEVDR